MANLEDLIDPEYGLQQDEWSLTRPRFGKDGQLEVIGWSGKRKTGKKEKYYILQCKNCGEDFELFKQGVFRSTYKSLVGGVVPCGCYIKYSWTEGQYLLRISREAQKRGFCFIGWGEGFKGSNTKVVLKCPLHGEWGSSRLGSFLGGDGCPKCGMARVALGGSTVPEHVHIKEFMNTGNFVEGTCFQRSSKLDSKGYRTYWNVYCPDCSYIGEASIGSLKMGHRPCLCSPARQRQAYVNFVEKETDETIAIKFGIANNSERRRGQQNSRCIYEVIQHSIYEFPDKKSCLSAERECKQTLECGVLTKEEMPDGYTETTWLYNLDKIISIYEKHGGKRIK